MPLTLLIAIKYCFKSSAHKFASFVAILSTLGITLGVAALIVDTAVMQGLENRLQRDVLKNTPHLIVKTQLDSTELFTLDNIIAFAPFVREQALIQSQDNLGIVNLQGINLDKLKIKKGFSKDDLAIIPEPLANSFELNAESNLFFKYDYRLNQEVRLVSTINARYSPMGITPTQRLFTLTNYHQSVNSKSIDDAIGNFEDVRRLFRLKPEQSNTRIWLQDPLKLSEVTNYLDKKGFKYTTWQEEQGEFFKAVALEKLTMGIMLCLIIIVAAFNILSALSMMVSSRLREIAILKTLGLTRKKILLIFIQMGAFSGFLGTILGVIIGIPTSLYVGSMMQKLGFGKIPLDLSFSTILIISIGSILMSLIFTFYPALKAAKTKPVEHLSRG